MTNIPGPQSPLYLMGRQLEAIFPMVPLAKRQAVCFGIFSYNGQVNFGLIGDYDAMGDLDMLAEDLEASITELIETVGESGPAPQPSTRERERPKAAGSSR